MKTTLFALLLALSTLACEDEPELDPRCVDVCEGAFEECSQEDGRGCEESCQASIEGFSPGYTACVLDRAYVAWRYDERTRTADCDFAIDDRDACTSEL